MKSNAGAIIRNTAQTYRNIDLHMEPPAKPFHVLSHASEGIANREGCGTTVEIWRPDRLKSESPAGDGNTGICRCFGVVSVITPLRLITQALVNVDLDQSERLLVIECQGAARLQRIQGQEPGPHHR